MRFGRILATTFVATSLIAAPIVAEAAAPARTGSHVKGEDLHGGFIVPLLALAAVIAGILVLINDKKDTLPHSP